MKNIVYRLKFIIEESQNKSETRDNRLTSILSTLEDIDTKEPISSPQVGSIIEIDSEEFIVSKKNFSFLNEGDIVFYTTLVYLKKSRKEEDPKKSTEDYLNEFKKAIQKYKNEDHLDKDFFGFLKAAKKQASLGT